MVEEIHRLRPFTKNQRTTTDFSVERDVVAVPRAELVAHCGVWNLAAHHAAPGQAEQARADDAAHIVGPGVVWALDAHHAFPLGHLFWLAASLQQLICVHVVTSGVTRKNPVSSLVTNPPGDTISRS